MPLRASLSSHTLSSTQSAGSGQAARASGRNSLVDTLNLYSIRVAAVAPRASARRRRRRPSPTAQGPAGPPPPLPRPYPPPGPQLRLRVACDEPINESMTARFSCDPSLMASCGRAVPAAAWLRPGPNPPVFARRGRAITAAAAVVRLVTQPRRRRCCRCCCRPMNH
jgi:hypothetical protein